MPAIPPWSGRRAREALARVKAKGRREAAPCWRCHESISYDLTYPHPGSCSVGHAKSRHDYPELTWDPRNWKPEHLRCNQKANGSASAPDLGLVSDW